MKSPAADEKEPPIAWVLLATYVAGMAFWAVTLPDEVIGNFFHDDAIFYLKIAQHIADGHGSTFDGINPTNGYHMLWMMVLVPFAKLSPFVGFAGLRPLLPFHALLISVAGLLIDRILQSLRVRAWWRGVTIMAILVCVGFTDVGIEAPVLLIAGWGFWLSFARLLADPTGPRFYVVLGAAAIALARTDAAIVPAIVWAAATGQALVSDDRDAKRRVPLLFALSVVPALLAGLAVGLHNQLHFGHFATVSSSLKTHFPGTFATHWFSAGPPSIRLRLVGSMVLALMALPILVRRQFVTALEATPRAFELVFIAACCYVIVHAGSILVMASSLTGSWYYALSLTVVLTVLSYGSAQVLDRVGAPHRLVKGVAAITLFALAISCVIFVRAKRFVTSDVRLTQYATAKWIKENVPATDVLFMVDHSGFVGYLSDRRVINGDGLVNGWEYRAAVRANRIPEYLVRHHVEWFISFEYGPTNETCVVTIPRWDGTFMHLGTAQKDRARFLFPDSCFGVFQREDLKLTN